jgi:hypothetical protein
MRISLSRATAVVVALFAMFVVQVEKRRRGWSVLVKKKREHLARA